MASATNGVGVYLERELRLTKDGPVESHIVKKDGSFDDVWKMNRIMRVEAGTIPAKMQSQPHVHSEGQASVATSCAWSGRSRVWQPHVNGQGQASVATSCARSGEV